MTKVIARHRLVTWFEEIDDPFSPTGKNLKERLAHMGEEHDISDAEIERIKGVNTETNPPFYTEEQAGQIRQGTYRGSDSEALYRMRAGTKPVSTIEPIEGEGPQTDSLDAEELAEYIKENKLNVDETVSLAGDTTESIEKVLDAENLASDNDPRVGVTERLEKKLAAITQK